MKNLLKLTLLFSTMILAAFAEALVNVDANQVAIEGYDPVAFFTEAKPVRGNMEITSTHDGAIYRFASAEHRDTFNQNPGAYVPVCGGFCAFGMSKGHAAPVRIETWQIVDGRLVLNYNNEVKEGFNKQRAELLKQAEANWAEREKNQKP